MEADELLQPPQRQPALFQRVQKVQHHTHPEEQGKAARKGASESNRKATQTAWQKTTSAKESGAS
jgi:hypothetical protein